MPKIKKSKQNYWPLFIGIFLASIVFVLIAKFAFGSARVPEYQLSPIPVTTGVYGKATLSPTCTGPKRSVDVCSEPFKGDFKATNTATSKIIQFSSNNDGQYKVRLEPGTYKITQVTSSKNKYPRLSNPVVVVQQNRLVEQPLILDSGIK